MSNTPTDRKHDQKVRLESHFDRVDVNIVDKSGESKIVTKSKCKHCDYLFTTPVSKVKKRALCHLLKIKRALDHIDHIFGRAQLRCLQKDHAGQV